jgi:hypothetical protein
MPIIKDTAKRPAFGNAQNFQTLPKTKIPKFMTNFGI